MPRTDSASQPGAVYAFVDGKACTTVAVSLRVVLVVGRGHAIPPAQPSPEGTPQAEATPTDAVTPSATEATPYHRRPVEEVHHWASAPGGRRLNPDRV